MHHKGGGDDRRNQVDERQREQSRDHKPPDKDASREALTHGFRRPPVEPPKGDHLEIGAAEKIAVQSEEHKKINPRQQQVKRQQDRKSTRLNSSHPSISYAVF